MTSSELGEILEVRHTVHYKAMTESDNKFHSAGETRPNPAKGLQSVTQSTMRPWVGQEPRLSFLTADAHIRWQNARALAILRVLRQLD